ncbi:MAG: hypothetical protein LBF22_07500 [Deltaproteobacteria bacterium]|nr:hypothetical protein [Deltaproteobacteria bacterium]
MDDFLSTTEKKIDSCVKFDSLDYHILPRIPELVKPFNQEILEKIVDLFYNKNIIVEKYIEGVVEGICQLNYDRLTTEQWKQFLGKDPMETFLTKIKDEA